MAIESVTRRTVRSQVARTVNDRIVEGTATAGGAATLDDTANLLHDDDAFNGMEIYIHTGQSSGDSRQVSDFDGTSNDRITVSKAWTATPNTTSQYEIHKRFTVAEYNEAIDSAIRATRWSHMDIKKDMSLLTNCALLNPLFANFTTANQADNWTNSGNNFSQALYNLNVVGKQSYRFFAVVHGNSTGIKFEVTDGTTTVSDSHHGKGWDLLYVDLAVAAGATSVTTQITVDAASSITQTQETGTKLRGLNSAKLVFNTGQIAYVDSVYAPMGFVQSLYEMPSGIHSLHKVDYETSSPAYDDIYMAWSHCLEPADWSGYGTVLELRNSRVTLPDNRMLTLHGLMVPDVPTSDTETLDINVELVRLYAAQTLLYQAGDAQEASNFKRQFDELNVLSRVVYPSNSRIITPN